MQMYSSYSLEYGFFTQHHVCVIYCWEYPYFIIIAVYYFLVGIYCNACIKLLMNKNSFECSFEFFPIFGSRE